MTPRITPDRTAEAGLVRYIEVSRQIEARLHAIIDGLAESRPPILVWGVGTHTQRLLETSRFGRMNIRAFIDSNPKYQGRQLNGVDIVRPAALRDRGEPVLISSRIAQEEIEAQIRRDLRCPNEVIVLYDLEAEKRRS